MTNYVTDVQKLYVAYFSRPADTVGLAFWTGVLAQDQVSGLAQISEAFASSAEYQQSYAGLDNAGVVDAVYHNLFGREGDATGVAFWIKALDNHDVTVDDLVMEMAFNGAQGDDKVIVNGRVSVSKVFTEHLDLPAEQAAYSGVAANAIAKAFIGTIVDLPSGAAAIDPGVIDAKIAEIVGTPTAIDVAHPLA